VFPPPPHRPSPPWSTCCPLGSSACPPAHHGAHARHDFVAASRAGPPWLQCHQASSHGPPTIECFYRQAGGCNGRHGRKLCPCKRRCAGRGPCRPAAPQAPAPGFRCGRNHRCSRRGRRLCACSHAAGRRGSWDCVPAETTGWLVVPWQPHITMGSSCSAAALPSGGNEHRTLDVAPRGVCSGKGEGTPLTLPYPCSA
jgi:hypothetical protein